MLKTYKAYAGPASELGSRLDANLTHADLGERLDAAYDEELRFQHENTLRPLEAALASSHALALERVLNARCARVLRAGQVHVAVGGGGQATLLGAQASPANYFVKTETASAHRSAARAPPWAWTRRTALPPRRATGTSA